MCGDNYVRRSWAAPLLATFGIVAGLLALSLLLLAAATPSRTKLIRPRLTTIA